MNNRKNLSKLKSRQFFPARFKFYVNKNRQAMLTYFLFEVSVTKNYFKPACDLEVNLLLEKVAKILE
jgi:hypothetical protein